MKRALFAFALLACASTASADTYITTHGVSYHGNRSEKWNEANHGLGIEHTLGDGGLIAGYYRNSYDKDTFYAGYAYRPLQMKYLRAGIMVAAATGYNSPVIAAPTINIGTDDLSVDIITAPAFGKNTTWFVGASLKWRLF